MRKFKIGLVGIGRGTAYGRVFANNPKTEVVAICDINEVSLEKSGKDFKLSDNQLFKNYDEFINADFDIAVIGTPIPYHAEQVVKALQNNKHVLSEVTAADTIKGCEQIVEAVKKSKMKYMLAENCNYMHFVRQWKEMIDAGKIGKIIYAEAEYVHEIRDLILDSGTKEMKWRAQRAPIHYCSHSVGLLNAPKGTRLYKRLVGEGRLLNDMSGDNTGFTINFIPKMNREKLLTGYKHIIDTIYSPKHYYERVITFLKEYKPIKLGVQKIKLTEIAAFFRSVLKLGIIGKERFYYWKLFFWSLFKCPRLFPLAISFSIYGYHFRKVFENE